MQSCRAESSAPLLPFTHSSSVAWLPWVLLGLKEAFLLYVCKWMHLVNKDWLPGGNRRRRAQIYNAVSLSPPANPFRWWWRVRYGIDPCDACLWQWMLQCINWPEHDESWDSASSLAPRCVLSFRFYPLDVLLTLLFVFACFDLARPLHQAQALFPPSAVLSGKNQHPEWRELS